MEKNENVNNLLPIEQQIRELNNSVRDLARQIQECMSSVSHSNARPTTTMNFIKNDVHINGFGHEDVSCVSPEFLTECLKTLHEGNKGIVDLVKRIHFDTQGNLNVKRVDGDEKDLVLSYFDSERDTWIIDSRNRVLDAIICRPRSMLKNHFEDNADAFKEQLTSALYRFVRDWFHYTQNKKHHVYADTSRKIHDMVKKWSTVIMQDMCREEIR